MQLVCFSKLNQWKIREHYVSSSKKLYGFLYTIALTVKCDGNMKDSKYRVEMKEHMLI